MPENDALGNPKRQNDDEITVSVDGVELGTVRDVNATLEDELIKLTEEQKQLIETVKYGCNYSGTCKLRDRKKRQKEKLPKKLRNGWK